MIVPPRTLVWAIYNPCAERTPFAQASGEDPGYSNGSASDRACIASSRPRRVACRAAASLLSVAYVLPLRTNMLRTFS